MKTEHRKEARDVRELKHADAWDRIEEPSEYEPTDESTAIDVLRQIAAMKRKTREQRLASACVIFLDSLPDAPPKPDPEASK